MRIAISGSHSLGKSTFVRDFLKEHPDYAFEEEPYRMLRHEHEIIFAEGQRQFDIDLQLNYRIERLKKYPPGSKVIFDRAPSDMIPYASYSIEHGYADIDADYVKSLFPKVCASHAFLDVIVFIPIMEEYPIALEDDGHRPTHDLYREWVDAAFKKLYRENLSSIMPEKGGPLLVEIWGDRKMRLQKMDAFLREIED